LLGSNDRGETWHILDARRNETFAQRYQRRVFSVPNEAPYELYRLQIDCVRVPANLPGGATCVQLAEIEPLYSIKDPGGKFSLLVSAEGENPPLETLEDAFDGKARTKWLSFTDDDNTNRSSWVQWDYLPGGEPRVLNLRWVKALQAHRTMPVELRLEGVAVSWDASSKRLGFLDGTGFQQFGLRLSGAQIQAGDRIRLSGRLELGQDIQMVSDAQLVRLEAVAAAESIGVGQSLANGKDLFCAEIEAKVTAVSEDSAQWTTVGLTSDRGTQRMLAKIWSGSRRIGFFPGCRLRLQGVAQALLDDRNERVAGAIWISDLDQVTILAVSEKDWSEWPLYTLNRLSRTNASLALGSPVRVISTVLQQDSETIVLGDKGTNLLRVYARNAPPLTPGTLSEAIGFLDRKTGTPRLIFAQVRPSVQSAVQTPPKELPEQDPLRPVTQIHRIYERLEEHPGKGFPVQLRGVITYIDLEFDSFYLHDGTDGIQVVSQPETGLAPFVKQEGSYVELRGKIDPNLQAVAPDGFVTILGKGLLPEARRHSWDYLITGKDDAQWVQIEGVVSDLGDVGLTLIVGGGRMPVVVNDFDKRAQDRLLGSLVRISGVCAPLRDNRNRRTGLQLLVPFRDCIEVLRAAPEQPFDLATRKISDLANQTIRGTNSAVRFVKTVGIVTYREPHLLFVQDGQDGLRVLPRTETAVEVGDRIEAVGFAEPDGFSPRLVQALVRKIGHEPLPAPIAIDLMGPDVTDQDATRVQVEAILVGQKPGKSLQILELNDARGDKTFSAFIPIPAETLPVIPIGSRVRLTGVFRTETETMADLGLVPTSFKLFLNAPQDLAVLHRPSWWTAQHTVWVAAAL